MGQGHIYDMSMICHKVVSLVVEDNAEERDTKEQALTRECREVLNIYAT